MDKSKLLVYLGKRTQQGANAHEITRTIKDIIPHPSYHEDTLDNDIALLRLSSRVDFNDYIRPVCLAAKNSVFVTNTKSWITGWGLTGPNSNTLAQIHTVQILLHIITSIPNISN